MVEGEMSEVSEEEMVEAIKFAHEAIKQQCQAQLEFREMTGSAPKREYNHEVHDDELRARVHEATYQKAYDFAAKGNDNKSARREGFDAIINEFKSVFTAEELKEKRQEALFPTAHSVLTDSHHGLEHGRSSSLTR